MGRGRGTVNPKLDEIALVDVPTVLSAFALMTVREQCGYCHCEGLRLESGVCPSCIGFWLAGYDAARESET